MPFSLKIEQQRQVMAESDYSLFQTQSEQWMITYCPEEAIQQWNLLCRHVDEWEEKKPEKRMLLELAFRCFTNPVTNGNLAQLVALARQVKLLCGIRIYRQLLESHIDNDNLDIQQYLAIMSILTDLCDVPSIPKLVRDALPDLTKLLELLIDAQNQHLAKKYPPRDIQTVISRFTTIGQNVSVPLPTNNIESLNRLKCLEMDYLSLEGQLSSLKTLPQQTLKKCFLEHGNIFRENNAPQARQMMIAIMIETIRRIYKIQPYDTQIISVLALLDISPGLRGRLGQLATGEGKTTVLVMLAAFMAAQGYFINIITSSEYLAIRDCNKYLPFYEALGLTAGHVCYPNTQEVHFHPQILLGTNSNFQFPLLRDGLSAKKICKSYPLNCSTLQPRTADVILVDEVDNMTLDTLGAARIAAPANDDVVWIFEPILDFVKTYLQKDIITKQRLIKVKQYIEHVTGRSIDTTDNVELAKWVKSAQTALYKKQKDRDYVIRPNRKLPDGRLVDDIVIVDYENTGRASEGCQWQHGLHQMLQLHNGLLTTPTSRTIASISHVSFYNEYKYLLGVTGTIGEAAERAEIESIYAVDSFDVPPHFPSQRTMLPAKVFTDESNQWKGIQQQLAKAQADGLPSLILFRTIEESRRFSQYLNDRGMANQLLNETQRESEDYIVARAGESGIITIATNTGGRGMDIILSNASKTAGGLNQIFAFFPESLRCESQGYGRAGRQGQPGLCQMMLSRHDPFVETLSDFKKDDTNYGLKFQLNLILKHLETEDCSSTIMTLLNKLRSKNIEQASALRYRHANQESFYYRKLKEFFAQFESVYQQLYDKSGCEKLTQFYREDEQSEMLIKLIKLDENSKVWRPIYNAMQASIENQSTGIPQDLLRLVKQGSEAYTCFIRDKWSQFYTKLTDQSEFMDQVQLEHRARELYEESNLEMYLVNPVETANACLNHLWKKAMSVRDTPLHKQNISSQLASLSLFGQVRSTPANQQDNTTANMKK